MRSERLIDDPALDRLAEEVRVAESRTSVEFVLVLSPASGSYADLDLFAGLVSGLTTLALILYAPWEVSYHLLLPLVLAGTALGGGLCRYVPWVRRRLCFPHRLDKQVGDSAQLAFMRHGVSCSVDRTGLLVFYSRFEDRLELLPDVGLKGRIPGGAFFQIIHRFGHENARLSLPERLSLVVRELAGVLAPVFPPRAKNDDELDNRPRLESAAG